MTALNILATLMVAAVVVTMALAKSDWQPSFIAGALAGAILLVFSGVAAVTWLTSRNQM